MTLFLLSLVYFTCLITISRWAEARGSRHHQTEGYLTGNHQSIWWLVTIGLIGDSLSGVTYLSVPASTLKNSAYYLQVVLGFFIGYWIIAEIFIPQFYRKKFISIYGYLEQKLGYHAQKTGASFFLISRCFGSATRLYLSVLVLHQILVLQLQSSSFSFATQIAPFLSFPIMACFAIGLILLYTIRGGIQSLVWTDTFQSLFLMGGTVAVFLSLFYHIPPLTMATQAGESPRWLQLWSQVKIFDFDPLSKQFFIKQILGGIAVAITMTGLDQNLMQKNLSCRNLHESKLNLKHFSWLMLLVTGFIILEGIFLGDYLSFYPLTTAVKPDLILSTVVMNSFSPIVQILFLLGLLAATFSSADSVLPTLTTSFQLDILHRPMTESSKNKIHIGFALLLLGLMLVLYRFNNQNMIDLILLAASYTYGPLLGLFTFAYFKKSSTTLKRPVLIPVLCILSPFITYGLVQMIETLTTYRFGQEVLILNASLTYLLLKLLV
jgi:Na+/proline symporter